MADSSAPFLAEMMRSRTGVIRMNEPLYGMAVLRLAAAVADHPPLNPADVSIEKRSVVCGSRVVLTLRLDEQGHAAAVGIQAQACALGQAAATVLARGIVGRSAEGVARVTADWSDYLSGTTDEVPDWPDLALLAKGRNYPARHASLRLAFEAASEAMALARSENAKP